MDEQQGSDLTDGRTDEVAVGPTGVAQVDRVLAEIDRLEELPVGEHVGAFERAQEQLRRALDAPQEP